MESGFEVFIEKNIAVLIYKPGLKINLPKAKEIVEERLKVCKGKQYPLLIDGREMKSIDRAAREYLNSMEGRKSITAAALLAGSTFSEYIGNFYLKISYTNPSFPAKLFTSKEKALQWLEQYKL